jgi:hypothetical protein
MNSALDRATKTSRDRYFERGWMWADSPQASSLFRVINAATKYFMRAPSFAALF